MRYLYLALVLLLAACDSPVAPVLVDTEREVAWTAGFRLDDGRYVWVAGHESGGSVYLCQVSIEDADALKQGDPLTCTWRLRDRPTSEMGWDESLMS